MRAGVRSPDALSHDRRAGDRCAVVAVGPERNEAWAKINHMIAEQAPAIPILWDKAALVQSKDVVGVASAYLTTYDLTYTSLK